MTAGTEVMNEFGQWRDNQFEKGDDGAFGSLPRLDFNVRILTQGWWPAGPTISLKLPTLFETCQRAFEQWYFSKHQNR